MSVYTPVSRTKLESFLTRYSVGRLVRYAGIQSGITNSNFRLETESGLFILTLYEHHQNHELDYILNLQYHLTRQAVACAAPVPDDSGCLYSLLNHKQAAISKCIEGAVCESLLPEHCALIGAELSKLHLFGADFRGDRVNPCGLNWVLSMRQKLHHHLSDCDQKLLREECEIYRLIEGLGLPSGAIHADLFHDNCLFKGTALSGIIDFDYACFDTWLYDIAVTVNDWCTGDSGALDNEGLASFLDSYETIRPLLTIERENLGLMLRIAAMRFWLSRLHDQAFPLAGVLTHRKDPQEFKNMLLLRRDGFDGA